MHDHRRAHPSPPAQLLDDYLAIAGQRRPQSLLRTSLRLRSAESRHLHAYAASGGTAGLERLLDVAHGREPIERLDIDSLKPGLLCELADVIAWQDIWPTDTTDAIALWDLVERRFGAASVPADSQILHAQFVFGRGDHARLVELLERYHELPDFIRGDLDLDIHNPFVGPTPVTVDEWLPKFTPIVPDAGLTLSGDDDLEPFDRLSTTITERIHDEHKVSVIMTSYRPDRSLVTAVTSILRQTWSNVEVLIVDDASGSEYDAILAECAELDRRVRMIRLDRNRGTYVARNTGMDAATGDFIAFQDSDDWSHPRRLEQQIRPMLAEPSLMAVISDAIKVTDQLIVTKPGRVTRQLCQPSVMFRKAEVMARNGYLHSIRKGADTEYFRRIEAAFGSDSTLHLRGVVHMFQQQTPGSLSRNDFRRHWIHPARAAYRAAFSYWHRRITDGTADSYLDRDQASAPIPALRHLCGPEHGLPTHYDVVLACDWQSYGGPVISMLEEIKALTRRGKRVAILHLEGYRWMMAWRRPPCEQIQQLINDGVVDQVMRTDDISTSLLIIRYPPVMQFAPHGRSGIQADQVLLLANQPPCERDGSDLRYVPVDCERSVRRMFGVEPVWVPQGPQARQSLERAGVELGHVAPFDIPGIIDAEEWCLPRTGFRSDIPVVGRHSRDHWTKWPDDRETLLQAYPAVPDIDVRNMGGAETALELLGEARLPMNWTSFRKSQVDVRSFLHQLDFWVYFPHSLRVEAFGRAILEAMAAGCVVILPPVFAETFGDGAVYREPEEVQSTVRQFYANPTLFLQQSRRGQEKVRKDFNYEGYVDLVNTLIGRSRASDATGSPPKQLAEDVAASTA